MALGGKKKEKVENTEEIESTEKEAPVSELRCFMHRKNKGFTIPIDTPSEEIVDGKSVLTTLIISFRNYVALVEDPFLAGILEQRVETKGDIVEIPVSRMKEAQVKIASGEAKPAGVADLLDIRKL
ncbi:hypothetical protein KAR91_47345 [Candidatus Pacearchaeota archaeon]|nr:hypothetical protein [Candidatus Pacearchaeota archaeon]